jgi:SAM-dependent methyltransferase
MAINKVKRDRQFPLFVHTIPFRRLFDNPKKFCHYVTSGQVVADLGCGAGYYTFALAECVGPKGKVYAVELNEKSIRALEKKANKRGYQNIKAYASSAADINFIKDGSVDFILANGLLCAMAPEHHESAVNEMIRILKPNGKAFIRADGGLGSYMSKTGWEKIIERFRIERRSDVHTRFDNWAVVSKKQVNQ